MQARDLNQALAPATASQSLAWSVSGHAAAIVAIVWLASSSLRVELPSLETKPFTLVHAEGAGASAKPGVVEVPRVTFSAPSPMPAPRLPAVADAAAPVRRPVAPVPTPAAPARERPGVGRRMSVTDFRRLYGTQAGPAGSPASRATTVVRHVNLGAIEAIGPDGPVHEETPAALGDDDALSALLKSELAKAFASRPELDAGLTVCVRFRLRTDGTIGDAVLMESSADSAFDQLVLAALGRFRLAPIQPRLVGRLFQTTFRTQADEAGR